MTSPQVPAMCPTEGVELIPDHLRALALVLGLALAQAVVNSCLTGIYFLD
jgi:hypothetical protein